jgi:putative ABC transport system substrate-binding protein
MSAGAVAAASVFATCGPPPRTLQRIGWLWNTPSSAARNELDVLRTRMRELGYEEGRDLEVLSRFTDGRRERVEPLVAELRSLQVKVILSTAAAALAKPFLGDTPLVMAVSGYDPVELGTVESLARPGGNITGVALLSSSLILKRMELLKEIAPGLSTIGLVRAVSGPPAASALHLKYGRESAEKLGVRLVEMDVDATRADRLDEFLPRAIAAGAGGFTIATAIGPDELRIAELAIEHRLPAVFTSRDAVEAGGLVSIGDDATEQVKRAAGYVDKILRGARPAELPIDIPEKLEVVMNARTAVRLGLTLASSVLQRADDVVR